MKVTLKLSIAVAGALVGEILNSRPAKHKSTSENFARLDRAEDITSD